MKYCWLITRFALYGFISFSCMGTLIQLPFSAPTDLLWSMPVTLGAWGSAATVLSCCAAIAIKLIWQELMPGKSSE